MKLILNIDEIQIHSSLLQQHDLAQFQQQLEQELIAALQLKNITNSFNQDIVQQNALGLTNNKLSTLSNEVSMSIVGGIK